MLVSACPTFREHIRYIDIHVELFALFLHPSVPFIDNGYGGVTLYFHGNVPYETTCV